MTSQFLFILPLSLIVMYICYMLCVISLLFSIVVFAAWLAGLPLYFLCWALWGVRLNLWLKGGMPIMGVMLIFPAFATVIAAMWQLIGGESPFRAAGWTEVWLLAGLLWCMGLWGLYALMQTRLTQKQSACIYAGWFIGYPLLVAYPTWCLFL